MHSNDSKVKMNMHLTQKQCNSLGPQFSRLCSPIYLIHFGTTQLDNDFAISHSTLNRHIDDEFAGGAIVANELRVLIAVPAAMMHRVLTSNFTFPQMPFGWSAWSVASALRAQTFHRLAIQIHCKIEGAGLNLPEHAPRPYQVVELLRLFATRTFVELSGR